ncbi:hypothetical protein [Arthrobacter sp.]|uniref:hypothetical protein n=1 Tax=Arthrobacter sp. TaxID=1667 RepID=UPI003A940C98
MTANMNERGTSPRRKTITLWASIIILVLIAGMAFLIFANPAKDDTKAPAAGGSSPAATPAAKEGCDVPAGDTSSTPDMPKDLRWEARDGWTWPVSDTYGPTQHKDGYGVCFARSPLGAALMAVNFNSAGNVFDAREALDLYLVDSAGKDVQLAKATSEPSTPISYSGFITDSFTPDHAQVTLVFSTPDTATGFTGLPLSFRWVDGDWKQEVLDDGSLFRGQAIEPQRGDFVEWKTR